MNGKMEIRVPDVELCGCVAVCVAGLWVVLAAATHSTHRTVLQQVSSLQL
jgi:hypothetical protein